MQEKILTFGEKSVGLEFNPGNDPKVQEVKELYAKIVDLLSGLGVSSGPSERLRNIKIAITQAEIACMCASKAITWLD